MNNIKNKLEKNKTICIFFEKKEYENLVNNAQEYRNKLDKTIEESPELFPVEIKQGYELKDKYYSIKLNITTRRIKIGEDSYTIRPSFLMPYMTAKTDDVEKALFLRKFSVPFWALTYVFGRNNMYWYRLENSIARNSIVGTTVNSPEKLPEDLCADEKHSWLQGERVYIATTVGNDCILGVDAAKQANSNELESAYEVFKKESEIVNPNYSPKTVNIDGWEATKNAWISLFPCINIILCMLHVFISIRDRSQKKFKEIFTLVADKLWHAYRAENRRTFSQRIRRLYELTIKSNYPMFITEKIAKIVKNIDSYANAFYFPNSHRTSNMLERIVKLMDKHLFNMQYFHGNLKSSTLAIRAWALIYNFAPWNPNTVKKCGFKSPAHKLNGFHYHENWLQNLLISASLGGYRDSPRNPL